MNQEPILCYDVIFKSLFIDLEDVLIKLIYDITKIRLNHINFVINEIPIVRKNEKFKRCDFVIETDKNLIINIELNHNSSKTMLIKNTSYAFSLFSRYTTKGNEYIKDLKVIQININCFSKFNKPVLDYRITNLNYHHVYFEGLIIYDLDIVTSKKLYYNERIRKRNYIKWGALFACTSIEEMEPILNELLTKKEVYQFMSKLKKMTVIHNVMDEKEALELEDKIRRSLYAEGLEEGFCNGKKEGLNSGYYKGITSMIQSMFKNNIDITTISKISNKSIEEINKIINIG